MRTDCAGGLDGRSDAGHSCLGPAPSRMGRPCPRHASTTHLPFGRSDGLAVLAPGAVDADPCDGHERAQRTPAPQPDSAADHTPAQPRGSQLPQGGVQVKRPGPHRHPHSVHGDGFLQACASKAASTASRPGWRGLAQLQQRHRVRNAPAFRTRNGHTASRSDGRGSSAAAPDSLGDAAPSCSPSREDSSSPRPARRRAAVSRCLGIAAAKNKTSRCLTVTLLIGGYPD